MKEHLKDEKIIEYMVHGLDSIDTDISVPTPDMQFFRGLVSEVEHQKKKKANRDTWVFMACAILILGIELFGFSRSVQFFIAVQAGAFAVIPIVALVMWRLRRRQVNPL